MQAQAIFHIAPHTVAVRDTRIPDPNPGELLVETHFSAVIPATESLIFSGESLENGASAVYPNLLGTLRYPFTHGHALVGEVVKTGCKEDREWIGRRVFISHPHQTFAVVNKRICQLLPNGMHWERALFLGSMETAIGWVLDVAPLVGERAMVFGQEVVGLLTTAILARFPLGELITADPVHERRELSRNMGADLTIDISKGRELVVLEECLFSDGNDGLDLVIEVSGQVDALNQAIRLTGFNGRIVVGSWYAKNTGPVELGGLFHSRRIQLISSQPNAVNPSLTGRWNPDRKRQLALEWLDRIQPENLITHRFSPSACQEAFEKASDKRANTLQVVFHYR